MTYSTIWCKCCQNYIHPDRDGLCPICDTVLQSAPPANELPGNDMETLTCACGMPSVYESGDCLACGAVGNSPAPADRPEPSKAQKPFAWYRKNQGREMLFAEDYDGPPPDEQGWTPVYLSQPAAAVPDAVRRVIRMMRHDAAAKRDKEYVTDEMDARAMAVADSEEKWALHLERAISAAPTPTDGGDKR